MPITLGRSTQNVTAQQSVEAHAALTSMKNHLQQRIDKAWLPPGVLRVRNLKAPAEGAADPGIKVTRDRWYHMFSRKSTRMEASAHYVRNLFESAYGKRLPPELHQRLMDDLNGYLKDHRNQLGSRSFIAFVDRFEALASIDMNTPPPTTSENMVSVDTREVSSMVGKLPAGMDFRAGTAARGHIQREFQAMLDHPYEKATQPYQDPFSTLSDPHNDPRLRPLRADIERSVYAWGGAVIDGDTAARLDALQDRIAGDFRDADTAENVLRDLAQIIYQRAVATPADTPELHYQTGQEEIRMPWGAVGGHGPRFDISRDPESGNALLIAIRAVGTKNIINVGVAAHPFGTGNEKPIAETMELRLRYTPSTAPGTPGRIEVLDVAASYRIDESQLS